MSKLRNEKGVIVFMLYVSQNIEVRFDFRIFSHNWHCFSYLGDKKWKKKISWDWQSPRTTSKLSANPWVKKDWSPWAGIVQTTCGLCVREYGFFPCHSLGCELVPLCFLLTRIVFILDEQEWRRQSPWERNSLTRWDEGTCLTCISQSYWENT